MPTKVASDLSIIPTSATVAVPEVHIYSTVYMLTSDLYHTYVCAHLFKVLVAVDILALRCVLQPVRLDVLPQGVDDDRPGLRVNAQHARKPRI